MRARSGKVFQGEPQASLAWHPLAFATLAFFAAYMLLDLREGGRASNLFTTRLSTPSFYVSHFGAWFFWGSVVLSAVLAVVSAVLVVGSIRRFRASRTAVGGICTGTATLLFGVAVFGCPGCIMPLFGTLGIALFANALPLFGLEFKMAAILVTLATIAWTSRQRLLPTGDRLSRAGRAGAPTDVLAG